MSRLRWAGLVLVLGACTSGAPYGEQGAGHPVAGQIFRVADGVPVSRAALVQDAAEADFVLIGERHDNPLHHRVQAELVEALQARSDRPRPVAFEMIPAARQLAIVEYLDADGDVAGLGAAVDWDSTGWPDWAWYRPIAEAALANDAQIVGADLDKAKKRAAFVQGAEAFRLPFVQRTGLAEAWPPPMMVSLQNELRAAHCDQAQGNVVIGMMRVQRARDAMMADRLAATSGKAGGVLIAGNGHVRKDRGVPWYLARLRPGARSVSIGLLEVRDDVLEPPFELPYDYVWFTPRIDDGDPCETHDADLQRLRQAG
ncbi:MAG: ChaN family lipoprotein [Geminicoccales bacterium]